MSITITKELQPNSALIHIMNNFVNITTVNDCNTVESKNIAHDDFLKVLTGSMKSTSINDNNFDQYILGSNIIKFKVSTDGFVYYFLVRKGKYPYNNEGKIKKINYPNMIFKLTLDPKHKLRHTKVAIIKDDELIERTTFGVTSIMVKENAELFKYELGNVDYQGDVCWGGNTFEAIDNYNAVCEVVSTFLNSPSNTHHIDTTSSGYSDRKAFFNSLVNNEYDENLLRPMKITFERF